MGPCYFACNRTCVHQADQLSWILPIIIDFVQQPNIFHVWIFGCVVYVPIAPPQLTKMTPKEGLGYLLVWISFTQKIFESYDWSFFKARFVDCHFYESVYPTLWGQKTLFGIFNHFLIWILEQIYVSKKFKKYFIYRILWINCQMLLLIFQGLLDRIF